MEIKERTFTAFYPSGRILSFPGVDIKVLDVGGKAGIAPVIFPSGKTAPVNLLDPRAVVCCGSDLVYNPRSFELEMSSGMRQWMAENEDWPSRLVRLAFMALTKETLRPNCGKSGFQTLSDFVKGVDDAN